MSPVRMLKLESVQSPVDSITKNDIVNMTVYRAKSLGVTTIHIYFPFYVQHHTYDVVIFVILPVRSDQAKFCNLSNF